MQFVVTAPSLERVVLGSTGEPVGTLPPMMRSLPSPPSTVSDPPSPTIVSLPSTPNKPSSAELPTKWSPAGEPRDQGRRDRDLNQPAHRSPIPRRDDEALRQRTAEARARAGGSAMLNDESDA